MNLINEILDFMFGKRYYANIVNIVGTFKMEICSYIFTSKKQAMQHKREIEGTSSFMYITTISFRSKKIYIKDDE